MATEATKLTVKVVTGSSASGKPVTAQRTFSNINPEISDADAYAIGCKLGTLQSHEVSGIIRTDTKELGA